MPFWRKAVIMVDMDVRQEIIVLIARFMAVVLIICLHEFAHAYVANKCGDPTAKLAGRMTLNPVKHFDPIGMLMFAVAGFGWANPVPINPNNFRKRKLGAFLSSAAGIVANVLFAFLVYPLFFATVSYLLPLFSGKYMAIFLYALTSSLYLYSLNFAAFNLLPLYPLDGFRMVEACNKKRGKVFLFLRNYGQYILLGLILISIASDYIYVLSYIDLLGHVLGHLVNWLGQPIALFWNWIFSIGA